jgi:hypothetical protein
MPPMPPRRRQTQPTAQTLGFPAPMGGLNTVAAGLTVPVTDCVSVWNLIPSEAGLRNRQGYREWVTNLTGSANDKVRTLLSFSGSEPSQNRLFATTDTGIWPATTSTAAPSIEYTFASSLGDAGYGMGRVVVTSAGHFYVYCDEVNGLHVYAETGATWTAPAMGGGVGEIANVDPADLVHATVFKKRVWFTERDSTSAWYLAAGAIFGSATEFDFGTHFSMGGHLVGLYNWTYDGGSGIDDSLVAVSSTGDVVVINGTDPSDPASFSVRGVWNMGPPPAGRDIAREVGGDLYLLSSLGIRPLSRLVVGATEGVFETAKIANLFNQLMLTRSDSRGWSMHLHPEDNALLLLYPDYSTETNRQLAQSQSTKGWFQYRDVPMHCATVWEGRLHFGTQDGRVCVSRDYLDNVDISDPSSYEDVEWNLLTSFQRAGGGNKVAVNQLRALFITDGSNPDVSIAARYGYDVSELPTPTASAAASGTWDNGLWDVAVWGGGTASVTFRRGATGSGHEVAVGIRGTALAKTTLVQLEAAFEVGGWL